MRFVEDDFSVQQRVVRIQLLAKSLSGEEIARELITTLSTELGIIPGKDWPIGQSGQSDKMVVKVGGFETNHAVIWRCLNWL